MHRALSFSSADDDHYAASSALPGVGIHLDAIYGFALTLTGDAHSAEELTEGVFGCAHDALWTTLGGHGLRDRLLARCVTAFRATFPSRSVRQSMTAHRTSPRDGALSALLLGLPWEERAAIALVDQLGLTYVAGAAVLGTEVAEFRALLHQGRSILFAAYRTGVR